MRGFVTTMIISTVLVLAVVGSAVGLSTIEPPFQDVPGTHPFVSEIAFLKNAGVFVGRPDGRFLPEAPLLRQQAAKIVMLATSGHTDEIEEPLAKYIDLEAGAGDESLYDYIYEATSRGYFEGSGGRFLPHAPITRIQLIRVLVRAGGDRLADPPATYDSRFEDVLDADAVVDLAKARFNGLTNGRSATVFDPWTPVTRAQAARMVAVFMDRIDDTNNPSPTTSTTFTWIDPAN